MRTTLGVIVSVTTLFLGGALHAATPEERCEAGKKREAGKYAACRLKAEARLSQGGEPGAYTNALQRCAAKLTGKFSKLEDSTALRGTACPTTDDADEVIAFVGSCSDVVTDGTAPGGSLPVGCSASNCGNGTIEISEACDLGNLNGGTCASEGFEGGVLRCGAGCGYDTSECYAVRFSDNGDGTITDHATGLMWEKLSDDLSIHDKDSTYNWNDAQSMKIAALNATAFAGYSDWRLPEIRELQTLINYAVENPAAFESFTNGCTSFCTVLECSCTRNAPSSEGHVWSATQRAPATIGRWWVNFADGQTSSSSAGDRFGVRGVRSTD